MTTEREPATSGRRRRPLPRLGQLAVLLVIVAALVVGGVLIVTGSQSHEPAAAPLPGTTFEVQPGQLTPIALPPLISGQPPTATSGSAGPDDSVMGGCHIPVQPAHVVIGSLCVNGPIVTTSATPEGALIIPEDVHQIGMWDTGAPITRPDQQPLNQGTTLLAGHVNAVDQGSGTFYNLYKVEPGALIYVADPAGSVTRWRVVGLDVVVKAALPKWVFAGPTGPRKLALVTCGGPIEHIPGVGNTYRDNVIVTAVPV